LFPAITGGAHLVAVLALAKLFLAPLPIADRAVAHVRLKVRVIAHGIVTEKPPVFAAIAER
jgi:hypothetical protein